MISLIIHSDDYMYTYAYAPTYISYIVTHEYEEQRFSVFHHAARP